MLKNLNESRKSNWKNSNTLTLVKTSEGRLIIETRNRYYDYQEMKKALKEYSKKDIASATKNDIIHMINEDYVDSEGMILNEVRYDWKNIDLITGLPKVKEPRPEESIELMNRMPARSGWIVMLHNRVNLNSTGNIHYSKKVWFDRASKKVYEDEEMTDEGTHFFTYMLPHCGKPGGWMYLEDYIRITHRHI